MTQENVKQRRILIVTSVGTKNEKNPGNPVISFGAYVEGQEELKGGYEAWGNDLVNMVVKDARLDCEVSFIPRGADIIQRVTQMFDEKGQPIRQKSSRSGSQYGGGKSDYQVALERRSIEGQTAYSGIIELKKVDKAPEDAFSQAMEWAKKKLTDSFNVALPAQPVETKESKPATKQPPTEMKTSPPITGGMISTIKQSASDKGYKKDTFGQLLAGYNVAIGTLGELTVAQGNEILDKIKKGEGLPEKLLS